MQSILQKFKQILVPTSVQAVLSVIAAIAMFVVIYHDILLAKLMSYMSLAQLPSSASFWGRMQRYADTAIGHNAVIIIFWSIVGLVAYSIFWTLINIGIEARNEMVIETTYTNKGSLGDRFLGVSNQIIVGLLLIIFVIISAIFLLPLWSSMFGFLLTSQFSVLSVVSGLASVLAAAVNLYFGFVMLQLVFISG